MKNLLASIPFSSPWIIRNLIGDAKTILDVGCGDGEAMIKINHDKKYQVTGVDLYKPYLEKAKESGVYKRLVKSDLRKIKFKQNSFDVVLASQVIEHLSKKDGLKLLSQMSKIAKDKVVVATPNGYVPFEPFEEKDGNPLQIHKSGWEIAEFESLGYKTYGQGAKFIYNPKGLLYKYRSLKNIFILLSYLFAPFNYFFPSNSYIISAVKNEKNT
jgi:ubiquinone/menaquinone biosynthesis C-methylase UbiE